MTLKFLMLLIISTLAPLKAEAELIEITRGQVKPEPISLVEMTGSDKSLATKIDQVIADDLSGCGMFELMNKDVFIQTAESLKTSAVRFDDWKVTKTRFLYFADMAQEGGKLVVKIKLYDVIRGQKMADLTLKAEEKKWRKVAHMIADVIYNAVTGEEGFFNTQIAFVQPTNAKGKNQNTCIKIMDSDGEPKSIMQVTDGKKLVLTPRYSPDGKTLAYLVLDKSRGDVFMMDLRTKSSKLLGSYQGLNFAPRFSPDGHQMVFSISKGNTTAIYKQNLLSNEVSSLTKQLSIDTSPSYSPDSKKIVFVSDRSGRPHLYVMNADGSDQARVSFGEGQYTQPCWSPRGDLIAYTLKRDGQFYIGLMKPDGSEERLLAKGYLVEDPIWTANGRYLLFTVQESLRDKAHIIRIDLTGRSMYQIKTPSEAFGPTLSPLLGSALPHKHAHNHD